MRVLSILKQTGADGPGLRNVLYVAGCAHHCPGCHNPESWSFLGGGERCIDDIIKELIDPYSDITISGGDPMYQPDSLRELLRRIKEGWPEKNIWVYTGFRIEELDERQRACLPYIDVLVDGPYIESLRDLSRFCGSSNQRIIYNPSQLK